MKKVLSPSFIFFGTRELGAIVLKHLLSHGYSPSLVVTGPDKPAGRKQKLTSSPVKKVAQEHNLPLAQPGRPAELLSSSELKEAEFIVLAAYGNILPRELVGLPPKGALNVHPSLLPKYRGPSPERGALLNGDEKTGVTVIVMDEKVDHGPILAQQEFIIPKDMRHEELHAALGELGGALLVETIPGWLEGKITPKEQDHSKATFTRKMTKEDGRIDWSKEAVYIERQVRALYPWPGTYTKFEIRSTKSETIPKILKILNASFLFQKEKSTKHVGETLLTPEGNIAVQTGQDVLVIDKLQLEGGKPMSAREFLLGHKDFLGIVLSQA